MSERVHSEELEEIQYKRSHKSKLTNHMINHGGKDRGGRKLSEAGKAGLNESKLDGPGYGPLQVLEKRLAELDWKTSDAG